MGAVGILVLVRCNRVVMSIWRWIGEAGSGLMLRMGFLVRE